MALSFCQCLLHSGNLAHASDVYMRLTYEARMPVYSFTMRNKPGNGEKIYIYVYISVFLVNTLPCMCILLEAKLKIRLFFDKHGIITTCTNL